MTSAVTDVVYSWRDCGSEAYDVLVPAAAWDWLGVAASAGVWTCFWKTVCVAD